MIRFPERSGWYLARPSTSTIDEAPGPDDHDRAPMGIHAVHTIRETIMKAQRAAEGANPS